MKNLIKNKAFVVGFLIGLLLVGLINKFTADFSQITEECMYRHLYGFPFLQYESCDGLITVNHIFWFGFLGNILFALFSSFLTGLIFKFVWSKITSKNLR